MAIKFIDDDVSGKINNEKIRFLEEEKPSEQNKKSFWDIFSAGITPEMKQQHPYASAIAQSAQEAFATPAAYVNQALLNYPRYLLEKKGVEYPQPGETTGGKIGYYAGGVAGALQSPVLGAINKLMGAEKIIAPATKLGERIVRGVASGAVTGGAYAQPTEQRPQSAALGGVLGGIFGVGSGIFRNIQKLNQLRKGLRQIKTDIGAEELPMSETPRKIGEAVSDLRDTLKQSSQEFDDIIETESLKNAKDIKPKIRKFGSNLSKAYGDKLDSFDNEINRLNRTANKSDVGEKWLSSAMDKVSDDPGAVSKLTKFSQDRGYTVTEYPDEFGNRTFSVMPSSNEIDKPVSFKELVDWKNSFKKMLSPSAKSGTGFKREDLAYKSIQDSWGEFLNEQFNKFQPEDVVTKQFNELQSEYAPLAQAKWQAYKTFRPFDPTDINIDRANKFFKDYAVGKAKAGQEELLGLLEKGNKLSPGIGDVTSRIKSLGNEKIQNEKQLTSFIEELLDYQTKVKDMLAVEKQMTNQRDNLLKVLGYGALGIGSIGAIGSAERAFKRD